VSDLFVIVSGCLFCVVSDLFGSVRVCPVLLYLTCLVVFMVVLFCCVLPVRYSQWLSIFCCVRPVW